jgi:hypothetical protein
MTNPNNYNGFTPTDLQLLLQKDLEKTLSTLKLTKPNDSKVNIKVYNQELPIPLSTDEDDENDLPPYIITRIQAGEKEKNDPMVIDVGLIICIYNNSRDRSGHFDLLKVIQKLESRFGKNSYVGNFEVQDSFQFALQDVQPHPYYYGGVILKFNAPKTIKEESFYT